MHSQQKRGSMRVLRGAFLKEDTVPLSQLGCPGPQWLAWCDNSGLEKAEPAQMTEEASGDPGRWPVCNLPTAGADAFRKQSAVCKMSATE